jgi:polygalacturonase
MIRSISFFLIVLALTTSAHAQPSGQALGPIIHVTALGAVPDDDKLDTATLQAAIDAAHAQGGGTVALPAGTFDSGTLRLRSHVRLHVGPGATLRGSADLADYDPDHPHLLYGADVENVALTGTGRLDGQGPVFWREADGDDDLVADRDERPWRFVRFERSRDVLVRDLTFEDSPSHTLYFSRSRGVRIEGVTIRNPDRKSVV